VLDSSAQTKTGAISIQVQAIRLPYSSRNGFVSHRVLKILFLERWRLDDSGTAVLLRGEGYNDLPNFGNYLAFCDRVASKRGS
jgi:hypothetical protein